MWIIISVFLVCCCSAEKIIIIGAGAAGIATASRLLDHNVSDFRILEAEHRIGGRIHSFFLGNAFVDMGAEFVHGEKDNIVYDLAKDYLKHDKNIEDELVYYSGKRKTGDDLIDVYVSLTEDVENVETNVSLGEAFLTRYNASILEKYKNDSEMLHYSKNFLRTMECFTLSVEGAFSWFKPSAVTNYKECDGDQVMSWNGLGYKTILEMMLKNFPNETGYNIKSQVSFGKTVSKITQTGSFVKIKCQDGSEYTSEYVVFTPSIGVLKNKHKELFVPKLEKSKIDAIENMGFDGVMKIIFEFSSAWWGDQKDFLFVWNENEKNNLVNDIPFGPVKDGDHWLNWFFSIGKAPNNPNILIGWIVGPLVPEIEKLSEDQMKNGTLYVMRKFLGNDYNITEPIKVIHSKWCTNPNFRGTYSYESVDSMIKNSAPGHHELSQPIGGKDGKPRILFAGEATSARRFSTVDGAIETGYREADRLIRILQA